MAARRSRGLTRGERNIQWIEAMCRVPEGRLVGQRVKLTDEQKDWICCIYDSPTRRFVLSMGRKNGKALSLDTRIPTPDGWTTMGEIKEGDTLFDEKGSQCRVTFVTPVQYQRDCYWVEFADGSRILADADHQWTVYSRSRKGKQVTLTTKEMLDDVVLHWSRGDRVERNYSVDVAQAIDCEEKSLEVPPYTMGAWLGDGSSNGAKIYCDDRDVEVIENIVLDGYPAKKTTSPFEWAISDGVRDRTKDCLAKHLRKAGVFGNKHIPAKYLRGSAEQRMQLLQGLMDTDGTVSKVGQCEFVGVNERLCRGVLELVRSLGMKATWTEDRASINGKDCGPRYRVQFWAYSDNPVFRLERKRNRLKVRGKATRNNRNYIVGINPTESVPVRCIQVDSPSSLFLAGEGFTPTHNTALMAFLLLLHLVGPEARPNSQLFSTAQSREQASVLFKLAAKVVRLNPDLEAYVGVKDSSKMLVCPELGTEYRALSADASTAMGLSPVFTVHDELGQTRGPRSELYEALETASAAQDDPLSIVISTQAPTAGDLLSVIIDDALKGNDPRTKVRLYTADEDIDPFSEEAIRQANPHFDTLMNKAEVLDQAQAAKRMPSLEAGYRNLILNQRVDTVSVFVSRSVWQNNGTEPLPLERRKVYGGLDLSSVADLTALVLIGQDGSDWDVEPTFWLPEQGLADKARKDRVPYDVWHKMGLLQATPGASIGYDFVAQYLRGVFDRYDVQKLAFDRYNMKFLRPCLFRAGFTEEEVSRFVEFGQGMVSMSPALRELETMLLHNRLRHGNHPVLSMCAANAVLEIDAAENRKFTKKKATGRIDGMVSLAMAVGVASSEPPPPEKKPLVLMTLGG